MPDGSNRQVDVQIACGHMHDRLICWGRLYLTGGKGERQHWESDGHRQYFDYGNREVDDSRIIHQLVTQLPKPQHSLLLQAYYRNESIATVDWAALSAPYREILANNLAAIVNKGIRTLNQSLVHPWRLVDANDVDGIRQRAIRQLVNRELMLPDLLEMRHPASRPNRNRLTDDSDKS